MKKNKHIGSDFDTFLEQEGIRNEVELAAIKKIISDATSFNALAQTSSFLR
jgi:hypothetical protein